MEHPYYKGYLTYIEITQEQVRIKMDYWFLFDGFTEYNFSRFPRETWRSLQKSASRDYNAKKTWFVQFEDAVRKLHVGDAVKFTLISNQAGYLDIYQIEKISE